MSKQVLKIFGANLKDQSKGQYVVHDAVCRDCHKLHLLREYCCVESHDSQLSVSRAIWGDMIAEGSMTADEGLVEIHFAPCVTIPVSGPNSANVGANPKGE
jgi:hypothetical protein